MTQSTSSRRITWKPNRLFSIKLRNGHYALLQMLSSKGQVAVFDCFQDTNDWSCAQLSSANVMFDGTMLDNVLGRSCVTLIEDVAPVEGLVYSKTRIHIGGGFRTVRLWEGTEDEREFLMMGEGKNKLCRYFREDGQPREEYTPIALEEYDEYKNLELITLYAYPSFNERLYLCDVLGCNVDPLKEIAFCRTPDRECRTYVDIIAGKTPVSELGY